MFPAIKNARTVVKYVTFKRICNEIYYCSAWRKNCRIIIVQQIEKSGEKKLGFLLLGVDFYAIKFNSICIL